jgi:hypothetical protein
LDDRLDTYFDKKYRKRKFSGNWQPCYLY